MKKRLVSMILAISMVLSLVPAPAFAQGVQFAAPAPDTAASPQELEEENADGVTRITITSAGKPSGSGSNWIYYGYGKLELKSGSFILTGNALTCKLVIDADATLTGGTVTSTSSVQNDGTIEGGTFNAPVANNGTISGGLFTGDLTRTGTINGGYFLDKAGNSNFTVIEPYNSNTATLLFQVPVRTAFGSGTVLEWSEEYYSTIYVPRKKTVTLDLKTPCKFYGAGAKDSNGNLIGASCKETTEGSGIYKVSASSYGNYITSIWIRCGLPLKIDSTGYPVGTNGGKTAAQNEDWDYRPYSRASSTGALGELTLGKNFFTTYDFADDSTRFTDGATAIACDVVFDQYAEVRGGTFNGSASNASSRIRYSVFNGPVKNYGSIILAIFTGELTNYQAGTISSSLLRSTVSLKEKAGTFSSCVMEKDFGITDQKELRSLSGSFVLRHYITYPTDDFALKEATLSLAPGSPLYFVGEPSLVITNGDILYNINGVEISTSGGTSGISGIKSCSYDADTNQFSFVPTDSLQLNQTKDLVLQTSGTYTGYPEGYNGTKSINGGNWKFDHATQTLIVNNHLELLNYDTPIQCKTILNYGSSRTYFDNEVVMRGGRVYGNHFNGKVTFNGGSIGNDNDFNNDVVINNVDYSTSYNDFTGTANPNATLQINTDFELSDRIDIYIPVFVNSGTLKAGTLYRTVLFADDVTLGADASMEISNAAFVKGIPSGNVTCGDNTVTRTVTADFDIGYFAYGSVSTSFSGLTYSSGAVRTPRVYTQELTIVTPEVTSGSSSTTLVYTLDKTVEIDKVNGNPASSYYDGDKHSIKVSNSTYKNTFNNQLILTQKLPLLEIQGSSGANPGYPKGYAGADMKGAGWEFKAGSGELIITGEVDLTSQPEVKVPIVTVQENATLTGGTYNKTIQKFTNNGTLDGKGEYNCDVLNNGAVTGSGFFNRNVTNTGTLDGDASYLGYVTSKGIIQNGTFYVKVTNSGIIKNGSFQHAMLNEAGGTVEGGTFYGYTLATGEGTFTNEGTIKGGTFSGVVKNSNVIQGGTFSASVTNNENAVIEGGTFTGDVTNSEGASIENGIFRFIGTESKNPPDLTNDGVISGGSFTFDAPYEGFAYFSSFKNNGGITGGTFAINGSIVFYNYASIENGTFTITAPSDPSATDSNFVNLGTIEGGTFKSDRELSLLGTVTGTAVFNSSVIVLGSVEGGTFNGSVTNANNSAYQGKISGGTFNAAVDNASTISGGTFTEKVSTSGTITDGRFEKEVTESSTSSITGGIFKVPTMADVVYSRTLTGNVSYSDVQDLYACVKNDKKFAGAKILFSTADGKAPHASGDYSYSILVTDKEGDTTELTDPGWQFHLNSTPLTFDGDGVPEYGKAPYNNATGLYEGDGWTYDEANHKLTLTASMDLGMTDPAGPFCSVETVIEDGVTVTNGRFTGNVQNDGTIESGSFYGSTVTNNGTIQNGTFRNDTLNNNGIIENGGFLCTVNNRGILEGGSYHDTVVNADNGVIRYGEFVEGSTVNNYGTIEDGAFIGVVLNLVSADEDGSVAHKGEIKGGSFPGTIENQSILSSGRFNGNVVNQPAGTITGGDFKECTNLINRGTLNAPDSTFGSTVSNHGTIEDGTFAGLVLNYTEGSASGVIHGGTFQTDVNNSTSITGGSFAGHVTNLAGATISGGSFGSDVDNAGTIEDGTFTAPVDNSGIISGGTFEEIVTDEEGSVIHKGAVFKKPGPDDVQLSTSDLPTEGVYSDLTSVTAAVTNPNKFADAAIQYVLNGTVVDKPQKPGDYTCNVVVTDNAGGTHVLEELAWTFHLNGAPLTFDSYGKPICTDAEQNEETGEWIGDGWTYIDFGDGTSLLTISRSMDLGDSFCSVETQIAGTDVTVTGGKFSGRLTVSETCTLKDAVSTGKVINLGTLTGCTLKDLINYLQGSVKDCEVSGNVENSGILDSGVFTATSTVRNDYIINGGTFHGTVNNNFKATVKNGEFTGTVNNGSVIEDGTFSGTVNNLTNGVIRNGTFTGEVKNITTAPDSFAFAPGSGTIENGEFTGKVTNDADAVIKSGTFKDVENAGILENGEFSGTVNNTGTIKDGTFHGTVTSSGTIADGTFAAESTVTNSGTIENGAFDGKVTNTADGVIESGSFTSEVENNGRISGGVYEKPVANEGLIEAGDFYDYVTGNGTITGGNFIPTLADFVDVTYPLDPVPASELAAQMHASLRNANKFQRVEGFLYKRESAIQTFAIRDDLAEDGNTGYSADAPILPGVYSFRVQVTDNAGVLYTLKNDAWKVTIKGEPLVIVDGKPVTDHVPTDENGTYFGDGWTYDGETLTLTKDITFAEDTRIDTKVDIAAGTTVTGGRYTGEVANSGTLQGAALSGTVKNDGTITGSTLTGEVTNNDQISDSTFTGASLTNEGSITGGSVSGGTLVDNGTLTNVAGVTTLKVTPLCDVYVGEDLLAGHSVLTGTEITLKLSDTVDDSGFSHWIIDGPEGELTWDELNYDDQKAYAEAITQRDFTFTVQEGWSTLTILVQEPGSDTSVSFDAILGTTLFVGTTTVIVYELTTTRYLQSILPEGAAIPRTRSQLAVLLWQAAGKPEPTVQTPYSDIPETETETNKAARWAVETGLLDEKRNATFAPNRYVSKLQVIQAWNKLQEKSSK